MGQRLRVTGCLLLALLLTACASHPPSEDSPHRGPTTPLLRGDRDLITMTAFAQVGKPYRYGGNGPDAFDCSGLVRYAYAAGGARTPRSTAELFVSGQPIDLADAKPADLLFYRFVDGKSGPSHVVLYLGDGEGLHAPSTGSAIRAVRIDLPYFTQRFVGARRLLE